MKRIVCFHSDVDFGVTTHLFKTRLNLGLDIGVGVELGRRHAIEHQRRITAHFDLGGVVEE